MLHTARCIHRASHPPIYVDGGIRNIFPLAPRCHRNDASLLLDESPDGGETDKSAGANIGLRGLEVIDQAKAKLEKACRGVVSCADIISFAARDATVLAGGHWYPVAGGRQDGKASRKVDADTNLVSPTSDLHTLIHKFGEANIRLSDIVTLSGAHTFGRGQCQVFRSELSRPDSTLDPHYAAQLRQACSVNNSGDPDGPSVPLDPVSATTFDRQFYTNLMRRKGLFPSDRVLYQDARTKHQVVRYSHHTNAFLNDFKDAVTRLSLVGVEDTHDCEIRLNCRRVNQS